MSGVESALLAAVVGVALLMLACLVIFVRTSRRSAAALQAQAVAAEQLELARSQVHAAREQAETVLELARADAADLRQRARAQAELDADAVLTAAAEAAAVEVDRLLAASREQAEQARQQWEQARSATDQAQSWSERLDRRERLLAEETQRLAERDRRLTRSEAALAVRDGVLLERAATLADAERLRDLELSRVAELTRAQARAELLASLEQQAKREAMTLARQIEADAVAQAEVRARAVVVEAIQRVASEQTAESVVSVLHLPSDEMKGRIIGREGRNIRTFETVTGVNLIIDDTPEAVLLSCFDPVRREVGRLTLEKLVLDGRIQPHRIEEIFVQAQADVRQLCQRAAEDALLEVGITEIHPELVRLLGRLRYRTSYGQNVLKHLVESAHLAGVMASELRMPPALVKRCAFLHDIGKALTHEVEGSHALVGADVARRYGECDEVVHAIEAHHNEVLPRTVEAVLTQASDACSGGRPGARRESLESYVQRLARIEEIASTRPGVEKVYAMQAGREVRVMVRPDDVDDVAAAVLAREVAKQIEEELTYPGQIRVTVVRESRTTEVAR